MYGRWKTLEAIEALGFNPVNTNADDLRKRLFCKDCNLVFGDVNLAYRHKAMIGHDIGYSQKMIKRPLPLERKRV